MTKAIARKEALSLRKLENSDLVSIDIVNQIIESKVLDLYDNIGIYYPIGNEINIMKLVELYPNKNFYLPITRDEIDFIKYNKDDVLVDGLFNTKEPKGDIVKRDIIECYLVPCVAITNDNKRIGYGKGYYDRYLNDYKGMKIGICYKSSANIESDTDYYDLVLDKKIIG